MLENVGLSEFEAAAAEQAFYAHDREALKELTSLWNPEVGAAANPAYIARVRELEKELELSLLALAQKKPDDAT